MLCKINYMFYQFLWFDLMLDKFQKQSLYQSKINELEDQIQKLKHEIIREEEDFKCTSSSLEVKHDKNTKYLV